MMEGRRERETRCSIGSLAVAEIAETTLRSPKR